MPPFVVKSAKNFQEESLQWGKKMTFFKSDHRSPETRSKRKWPKSIRSSCIQIRKIYVVYFTVFCPGHFWVTQIHQLFWFPSGEQTFTVMIFFLVVNLILLLLICTILLLYTSLRLLFPSRWSHLGFDAFTTGISNSIAIKVENAKLKRATDLLICSLAPSVTSGKSLVEWDLSSWSRVKRMKKHHHSH